MIQGLGYRDHPHVLQIYYLPELGQYYLQVQWCKWPEDALPFLKNLTYQYGTTLTPDHHHLVRC